MLSALYVLLDIIWITYDLAMLSNITITSPVRGIIFININSEPTN